MKINRDNLPQHIAIIMDGNGRWAKQHTIGRIRGHKKGAQARIFTAIWGGRHVHGIESA